MTEIEIVSRREDVLDELLEGPLHKRDLVDRLEASRSTVDRAIRELEETPLVEHREGGYVATLVGRLALGCYREHRRGSRAVFDANTALEPLPNDCDLPREFVSRAEVRVASEPAPYRPVERVHRTIRDADRFRALLPVLYDSRLLECCYDHAIEEGNPAGLVAAGSVVETVREDFPEQLKEKAACDWFTLRTGETPSYGLLLATRRVETTATALVFSEPLGKVHAVLETGDPGALQWAEERFERSLETAVDVTPDVPDCGAGAAGPDAPEEPPVSDPGTD